MLVCAALGIAAALHAACASAEDLRSRLLDLASTHGFEIKGLEKVTRSSVPAAHGDLRAQLAVLLAEHDHVVQGAPPRVTRVIVIGRKAVQPAAFSVPTTRRGHHHLVDAVVEGPAGQARTLSLMVDTGASTVVLPASLIAMLGFRDTDLAPRSSRTANGPVTGRAGRLVRVTVGGAQARDVEVLFIPDERLGDISLLGMSFFQHFALRVDQERDRLVLEPR